MGVNEGPWEKQHVAIISELQVERLESDTEWQSRLPEERLESQEKITDSHFWIFLGI